MIDQLDQNLLNDYQHRFPLVPRPFDDLAHSLGVDAKLVLTRIKALKNNGSISRVGPVFRPNTIGVSTLAAISVPKSELDHYAQIINAFDQVNHNYQREHQINLWFVLTAASQTELDSTIAQIEQQTAKPVLVLPMLKEYHIDLGFSLKHLNHARQFSEQAILRRLEQPKPLKASELASAQSLIAAIQSGLPLVDEPYQALAEKLDKSEPEVIAELKNLIESGAIKRFGVVVRHHEMGYRANAMVVWDVPNVEVDTIGMQLGSEECVTLCYQRPRVLPRWPYNLFCMIHGQSREQVLACIEDLRAKYGLSDINHAILFSGQRFKQRGAHYQRVKKS